MTLPGPTSLHTDLLLFQLAVEVRIVPDIHKEHQKVYLSEFLRISVLMFGKSDTFSVSFETIVLVDKLDAKDLSGM